MSSNPLASSFLSPLTFDTWVEDEYIRTLLESILRTDLREDSISFLYLFVCVCVCVKIERKRGDSGRQARASGRKQEATGSIPK